MSLMLPQIPNWSSVMARVNIKVKTRPVATLSILAANIIKPEYCNLISLFVKVFSLLLSKDVSLLFSEKGYIRMFDPLLSLRLKNRFSSNFSFFRVG